MLRVRSGDRAPPGVHFRTDGRLPTRRNIPSEANSREFLKQGIVLRCSGPGCPQPRSCRPRPRPRRAARPTTRSSHEIRHQAEGRVFPTPTGPLVRSPSAVEAGPDAGHLGRPRKDAGGQGPAYLDKYAGVFGAEADQLTQSAVRTTAYGWTVDLHPGLPGRPGLRWRAPRLGQQGRALTSVNGFAAPDLKSGVATRFSAARPRPRPGHGAPGPAGPRRRDDRPDGHQAGLGEALRLPRRAAIRGVPAQQSWPTSSR